MMVLGVRLVALLGLFCLCVWNIETQNINPRALHEVVTLIKQICKPENGNQYAVVTNLPENACTDSPNQDVFSEDETGCKGLSKSTDRLYKGKMLISALPIQSKYHSEYRLLIQSTPNKDKDYLIKGLQNKDKHGCMILYTFYSPCVNQCLNETNEFSIIPGLDTFTKHRGLKAFVYSQIYTKDNNRIAKLTELLQKEVDSNVPVFRCSDNSCTKCFNGVVNQNCFN